jgi:uncharacterized membrane protein YeaQ/YmgE (transglycosylase-associated protein family)
MNATIVVSWIAVGCFVAWIGTHLRKEQTHNSGVANLAEGVFGALLGGFVMHRALHALAAHGIYRVRNSYNLFTFCTVSAMAGAVLFIGLTWLLSRRADARVS